MQLKWSACALALVIGLHGCVTTSATTQKVKAKNNMPTPVASPPTRFCWKTSNTWPVQQCDTVVCNSARPNEYQSFQECCQQGFNRPADQPVRGKPVGGNSTAVECYLAPGVLDPPCWTPSDDSCMIECEPSMVVDKCRTRGYVTKESCCSTAFRFRGYDSCVGMIDPTTPGAKTPPSKGKKPPPCSPVNMPIDKKKAASSKAPTPTSKASPSPNPKTPTKATPSPASKPAPKPSPSPSPKTTSKPSPSPVGKTTTPSKAPSPAPKPRASPPHPKARG